MTKRLILAVLLLGTAAMVFSSCLVVARPRPGVHVVVGPPVEYGYQPLLYNGYVVYYDDAGIPFYWYGGARVWVPIAYRDRYITHYRTHHRAYRQWYKHRGRSYRSRHYKGQPGHSPRIHPKHGHDRPTISPKRGGKPTISPKRDDKPTIRPKKKKKDKPTIRPK